VGVAQVAIRLEEVVKLAGERSSRTGIHKSNLLFQIKLLDVFVGERGRKKLLYFFL
jgi:hypothetical protein